MTKTVEMMNNKELEKVNGGCDPVHVTDEFEIVQCKRCGEYYLTMNPHICIHVPDIDFDKELQLDLRLGGQAAAQE